MAFSWPCVGAPSFRRRVSARVSVPLSFLSPSDSPPLVAPASLPAQQEIFSIRSYLHALGTVLGFYPRCAHMQPAKKKLQIRKECRFEQLSLSRRPKMQRRAFLMRASAGVAAAAIARPASAQTSAPVGWALAPEWPKSLDTLYGGVEAMSQRVGQIDTEHTPIQCVSAGGE